MLLWSSVFSTPFLLGSTAVLNNRWDCCNTSFSLMKNVQGDIHEGAMEDNLMFYLTFLNLWDMVYSEGFAEGLLNRKHVPFANETWTCPLDMYNQPKHPRLLVESSWVGNKTSEGSTKKIERMFKKKTHTKRHSIIDHLDLLSHGLLGFNMWSNVFLPEQTLKHPVIMRPRFACKESREQISTQNSVAAPPSSAWSFEPPSRLSSLMLTWHPRSWLPLADQCLEQDHDESP